MGATQCNAAGKNSGAPANSNTTRSNSGGGVAGDDSRSKDLRVRIRRDAAAGGSDSSQRAGRESDSGTKRSRS